MDTTLLNMLPMEVVNIMDMLFGKGNVVKDFKLIGNSNGFSITMHICQPRGDLVHWSPSKISSTRSNQQSPAAHHRDQQRSEQWKANQPSSSSTS